MVGDGCVFLKLCMHECLLLCSITCAMHVGKNIENDMKGHHIDNIMQWITWLLYVVSSVIVHYDCDYACCLWFLVGSGDTMVQKY